MAGRKPAMAELSSGDLQEWLNQLSLAEGASEGSFQDRLRDGVLLCRLVNKIKPNSIENIKSRRSSGDAEENILRFLQACTTLGVKKIFKPLDLLDEKRDFGHVLVTIQQLHNIAADRGMGLRVVAPQLNGGASEESEEGGEEEAEEGEEPATNGTDRIVRAVYGFNGSGEDELQFEKGDLITVTKKVEGGWWEGVCSGKVGWFPGNYVEEFSGESTGGEGASSDTGGVHHYHNLVVKDILDSERTYVQDLHTLLSAYLVPLKSANIVLSKEVDQLTGNLPELNKWQQSFFKFLEDCSKLPVPQQNMGMIFLKVSQELETLYSTYCSNHPSAVAVLTENSDKLSAFMESNGAASPGMLTLTTNLSKPFRRIEKYPALLQELQRQLAEGHADTENVESAIDVYKAIVTRTQEIRKKREIEHEMLSNPVQGFSGSCLNELGECACVVSVNQALSTEEVDERYILVFPSTLVILAVGQSLSGYELKASYPQGSVQIKKGVNSDQWPWPVELYHKTETIHLSLSSDKDQHLLIDSVNHMEGAPPTRALHRGGVAGSKVLSSASSMFRAVPPRAMRKTSIPIQRAHHWGFKSLQPAPPLKPQQLMALREPKSPKAAKKFIYPATKLGKKRTSKHIDDAVSAGSGVKLPVDNKPGDTSILRVIEAYCAGGKGLIQSDRPLTHVVPRIRSHSSAVSRGHSSSLHGSLHPHRHTTTTNRAQVFSATLEEMEHSRMQEIKSKSSTLPGSRSKPPPSPSNSSRDSPFLRTPSPILITDYSMEPKGGGGTPKVSGKSPRRKLSAKFRKRSESMDARSSLKVKNTAI